MQDLIRALQELEDVETMNARVRAYNTALSAYVHSVESCSALEIQRIFKVEDKYIHRGEEIRRNAKRPAEVRGDAIAERAPVSGCAATRVEMQRTVVLGSDATVA